MDNRQSTQPRHPKQRLVTAGIALMACLVPVGQIFSEGWSNPLIGTHLVQGLAWALVLIGMAIAAEKYHQLRGHDLLVLQVLWCNLGAITFAGVTPEALRPLLLIVPLVGVMYAALYVARRQLILLMVLTLLLHGIAVLNGLSFPEFDLSISIFSSLVYLLFMAAFFAISTTLQGLRDGLIESNQKLHAEVEDFREMALKDELTGLDNRRSVMEFLARQIALVDRGQVSFALCYVDIDHFKAMNDQFGHFVGDDVLQRFSKLAKSAARSADIVARFGGEEFVIVLVGGTAETAKQFAIRLIAQARNLAIASESQNVGFTVSIGVAQYLPGEGIDSVIARADDALYGAKRAGRDGVQVSSSMPLRAIR